MNADRQLEERLRRLAWPVNRGMGWVDIEARAGGRKQPSAPARRSGLRVAVFASIAVVLVAAAAIGSVKTVGQHWGQHPFVLVINDDTIMGVGATGTQDGQWKRLLTSTEDGSIGALLIDPANSSVLYAATGGGLFKSSDGAGSWKQLSGIEGRISLLAIDPTSSSTVYAVTDHGFLRSDDGGSTWKNLTAIRPAFGTWPTILLIDPTSSPSTLYTFDYTWRSTDRGETWVQLSTEEAGQLQQLGHGLGSQGRDFQGTVTDADTGSVFKDVEGPIDPTDPSIRYAGTPEGVYKSTDGGKSWRKASAGLTSGVVWRVVADPRSASRLYAATSAGIFKSSDGGDTWNLSLAGQGSMVIAPSSPSRLYAWTSAGLFRTDNGGANWTQLAGVGLVSTTSAPGTYVGGLVLVAADNPDTVFAMTTGDSSALFRSTDGGNTWREVLQEAVPSDGGGLVVADPKAPSTLFAATLSSKVAKSTDAGGTWTVVSPKKWTDALVEIAVDPRDPSTRVYAVQGTDNGPFMVSRSLDGGRTWEKVGLEGLGEYLGRLLFDSRSPDTLYVLTYQRVEIGVKAAIYRSTDGGVAWENVSSELPSQPVRDVVVDSAPGGGLYVVTTSGLFKWVPSVR